MRYLFGPVPSRRLGLSLGVDMVPMKTCTLSCRYCQIGNTPVTTLERKSWVPLDEVVGELGERVKREPRPDWISFSGSGEPTLNTDLGAAIDAAKKLTDIPVCVITNGTLLWMPEVRAALRGADAVLPSLDSAVAETFDRLCRPHPSLDLDRIIEGQAAFRDEYAGRIWLEVLFVRGYNDSESELDALVAALERIRPDAVHLNTVARPPADRSAEPVTREFLEDVCALLGERADIIAEFPERDRTAVPVTGDDVRSYLKRRPGSADSISMALGADRSEVAAILARLGEAGEAGSVAYKGKEFWEYRH